MRCRTLVRHRDQLVKSASRSTLHLQKAMDQMNLQLHHVLSDVTGKTGLRIIDAILAGERDPARLAELADRRIKATRQTLMEALEGNWRDELLFTLRQARETYAYYQRQIGECDQQIEVLIRECDGPPTPEPVPLRQHLSQLMGTDLMLIPGIGETTALMLFTELGPDLSRFPSSAHFASWLGLCPKNKISGGKVLSSKTGPGANRGGPRPALGGPRPCIATNRAWGSPSAASALGSALPPPSSQPRINSPGSFTASSPIAWITRRGKSPRANATTDVASNARVRNQARLLGLQAGSAGELRVVS